MKKKEFYKVPHGLFRRQRLLTTAIVLCSVAVIGLLSSYQEDESRHGTLTDSEVRALLSVALPEGTSEIKCEYTGFDVSFNPDRRVPNYVAWELTASEVDGDVSRADHAFAKDEGVLGCADLSDYRRSGFDRGHMAPAADMKWSADAMRDCHLLTNIVPQDHSLNSGRWNALENKCRNYARRDSAVIVICGPVLSDRMPRTIGSGVAVPERFFKVIYAPYARPQRAIAFVMPNRPVRESLASMAMSVDQLEEITGMDFLHALPDSIETKVEASYRLRDWQLQ